MKAIIICREIQSGASKGAPDIGTGYSGFVFVGNLPGAYAVYVIVATGPQLAAIQVHANCVGGLLVTERNGEDRIRPAELDVPVPAALRTKINTYRQANGQGNIPASTTLLQVVRFAANHFEWGSHDVWDGV